ncbi:MAG: carboxypeptidase-like regulatory domain-containing protein [Bacteroidota bacterium]|nr:carboxypeptidase-like regulatory domain-containing protein [Bacteroidota bacterium]
MSKHIQLTIADPCHENWDKMTKAEQGRFCASCQKQVMDFTGMSDSQVAAFFKKPSAGSVCGRFYEDQLDRDIEIPGKRIPWVKYFFQFALPAFLFSMKATAQGKVKVASASHAVPAPSCAKRIGEAGRMNRRGIVGDTYFAPVQKEDGTAELLKGRVNLNKEPGSNANSIRGRIINENNDPIPFATLTIKGTKTAIAADSSGVFKMKVPGLKTGIVLDASSAGYKTKEITIPGYTDAANDIIIQLDTNAPLDEVIVTGYSTMLKRSVTGSVTSVMGSVIMGESVNDKIETKEIKPEPDLQPMIKVYPNPVQSGTNINVGCQKLKEGYYSIQLFNQAGQQVFNRQTWIDAEAQVLNIDIPAVAAGVYFLKLTNKVSSKKFTEKIIIQ